MKISACYIVKDEEKTLPRSIQSLRDVCHEVIVVDTGSTDGTVQVAEGMGARVLHYKWSNDFSKARNYAIANAQGDVIIFLDADEWFDPALTEEHVRVLQDYIEKGEIVFCTHFVNLFEDSPPIEIYLIRIFRNFIGLQYQNPVHEQLNKIDRQCNLPELFTVYHSGYMGDFSHKVDRNLALLREQVEGGELENPVMLFYAARESNEAGAREDAIKYLNLFFATRKEYQYGPHLLIAAHRLRMKLCLLDAFWSFTNAERLAYIESYVAEFPTHPVPWLYKGVFEFEYMGNLPAMEQAYTRMEQAQAVYDERNFPGDFSSTATDEKLVHMSRGIHAFFLGKLGDAMDCFLTVYGLSHDAPALNYLIHIVEGQPENDVLAFLSGILSTEDIVASWEQLLNLLIYFPALQNMYVYFARQLLLKTKEHSDLTAMVSIMLGEYGHAVSVAETINEGKGSSRLLCAAAFASMDFAMLEGKNMDLITGRVVYAFVKGTPLTGYSPDEWVLIAHIYRQLLFLQKQDAIARMDAILAHFPFQRFVIKSSYHSVSMHFAEILASFDLDVSTLPARQAAYCMQTLGQAYLGLGQYGEACRQFTSQLQFTNDIDALRRNLGLLKSLSPQHAAEVDGLIQKYESRQKLPLHVDEKDELAMLAIRKVFVAPELGRLTITLLAR